MVAFNSCIAHKGVLRDNYVGFDYSVALDFHLYFQAVPSGFVATAFNVRIDARREKIVPCYCGPEKLSQSPFSAQSAQPRRRACQLPLSETVFPCDH